MIVIDKLTFSRADFETRYAELANIDALRSPEDQLFAVCMKHPFLVLSTVFYLRDRGGSVLLLNGETPLSTAIAGAKQAGCSYLLYGERGEVVPLSGAHRPATSSLLQYSSGTTGLPKLIQRPWTDIELEIYSYNKALVPEHHQTPIILVPVYHSFGLIAGVMTALSRGMEPVIVTDKNPKFALQRIRSFPQSIVYGVPFLFHVLQSFKLDEVRFDRIISSGSPLSESLLQQLMAKSSEVWQQYGCSELGCISIGAVTEGPADVGRPLAHLSVFASTNREAPDEIMINYKGNNYHTGDLGAVTENHSLRIFGRMDDLINVSGLKVIPSEVESVIGQLSGVAEVVVYKTRHPVWGEAVKAKVVPAGPLRELEVKEWCMNHLPPYKVPRMVEIVTEIPRMPSGKISRKLIQEQELV